MKRITITLDDDLMAEIDLRHMEASGATNRSEANPRPDLAQPDTGRTSGGAMPLASRATRWSPPGAILG